tara:strand:+ start:147 stop:638 length:492 start_codon:yes stop_codon:yes gene_type:complete
MDNKYIDGKIYEIISDNTDMVYIGSCYITLKQRFIQHKCEANPCSSKFIIDCGDSHIYLIEKYPCNNRTELRMREQMYIDIYKNDGKNVINQVRAYTSLEDRKENKKNYHKNNIDKVKKKEYMKEYNKNNRDKKIEYMKEHNLFRNKRVCNAFYDFAMMLNEY